MKTLKYIALAALTLSFAACEKDNDFQGVSDPDAVKINATIGALQTRVAYSSEYGVTNFANGDAIKVVNTMRTSKNEATYTTTDGMTWTTTDAFVWNSSSKNKFQAYYPVKDYSSFEKFTIPADQSSAAKLGLADWMTVETEEIDKPEDGELTLDFQHRLAKVTVTIAEFTPQFASDAALDEATIYSLTADNVTVENDNNGITPYKMNNSVTAIICPGKYNADATLMEITVKDANGNYTLTVPVNDYLVNTGLAAGSHYTFSLKVGKEAVSISSVSVADWNKEEINGGVAEEVTPIIDGTLGGITEATEEDIEALVEQLKAYVDNGTTTIIVTGSESAMIDIGSSTITAIGEAIYHLSTDDSYNGKIDLILPDVTEIVDFEFAQAYSLNSITLPKVTKIGDKAFFETTYLRTITFGSVLTDINETGGVMFYLVGNEVGGCDLILNCGQMNSSHTPNLDTNTWTFTYENSFKSITLTHTGECDECKAAE